MRQWPRMASCLPRIGDHMNASKAWDKLKAVETSPEFEILRAQEFPYRSVALSVVDLRGRLEMTQGQLAQRVGTTQSVISRLESGRHPIEIRLSDDRRPTGPTDKRGRAAGSVQPGEYEPRVGRFPQTRCGNRSRPFHSPPPACLGHRCLQLPRVRRSGALVEERPAR